MIKFLNFNVKKNDFLTHELAESPAFSAAWAEPASCHGRRLSSRRGWGRRGGRCTGRQRDEFVVVEVRKLHAAGPPVGLGLFDPVLRGGDEVPIHEALAH